MKSTEVTIKDIARVAGVNHSTVSRSLNDSPLVACATKEKIKLIAREMGYHPNMFAQRLITQKSSTLGVFFLSRAEIAFMENFGTQFLEGIATETEHFGYDILLFTTTRDILNRKSYMQLCRERHVEGVIFIGLTSDDPHLKEISESKIPVCVIDYKVDGPLAGFVSTDNAQGVRLGLEHLWENGHRKIGFIGGPEVSQVAVLREQTYQHFMEEHDAWDPTLVYRGNFTKASGYQKALEMLGTKRLPTAVFAVNDFMALGAMKAFKEFGLRIPVDLSIIGFDNIFAGEYSDPGLTTIGQNPIEMGATAVRYLMDQIREEESPKSRLIQPRLIVRESVRRLPLPE